MYRILINFFRGMRIFYAKSDARKFKKYKRYIGFRRRAS